MQLGPQGTANEMLAGYQPSGEPGGDSAQLGGTLDVRDGCVVFVNDMEAVVAAFPVVTIARAADR